MKSANVLVKNENGECVIGDLGFAMILDPSLDSKQLASTGQVCTCTDYVRVSLHHNDVIQYACENLMGADTHDKIMSTPSSMACFD